MTHIYYEEKEASTGPRSNILSLFYLCLSLFTSTSLSLSVSLDSLIAVHWQTTSCLQLRPAEPLTNHVAWRCLLSKATNQAESEGPEVNRHGRSRDGRQLIRLYWFKRIAPHLRGIYQCVNCPLANHKSPALARPQGFTGNPEDWRDSIGRILSK